MRTLYSTLVNLICDSQVTIPLIEIPNMRQMNTKVETNEDFLRRDEISSETILEQWIINDRYVSGQDLLVI